MTPSGFPGFLVLLAKSARGAGLSSWPPFVGFVDLIFHLKI